MLRIVEKHVSLIEDSETVGEVAPDFVHEETEAQSERVFPGLVFRLKPNELRYS